MNINILKPLAFFLLAFALIPQKGAQSRSDWAEWRGPQRNGISQEKGFPKNGRLRAKTLPGKLHTEADHRPS